MDAFLHGHRSRSILWHRTVYCCPLGWYKGSSSSQVSPAFMKATLRGWQVAAPGLLSTHMCTLSALTCVQAKLVLGDPQTQWEPPWQDRRAWRNHVGPLCHYKTLDWGWIEFETVGEHSRHFTLLQSYSRNGDYRKKIATPDSFMTMNK